MDISRNKFSNTICVIFSLVLVGLFCVYTRSRLGLDNMVSCAIIAAVLCGIVACLIFFVNRIINKFSQGKAFNDKLIYNVVLIVVSLIFVVIRLLMISNVIDVSMTLGNNYSNAVSTQGRVFFDLSNTEGVVSTIISAFIALLGNSYFPIILVQLIFNIISYVLIMFGIKNLMGRMASLAVCFGLAVGPVFYSSIASDGVENIVLLAFGLIVFITSKYKKSIDEYEVKWYFSFAIGLLLGIFGLYHKAFLVLPVLPIIVLWDCNSEPNSKKTGNTFSIIIGLIIGYILPLIIDSFVLGHGGVIGFLDSISGLFSSRFGFHLDLDIIESFISMDSMLLVLLFCIAYCVLFWKSDDDAGHLMASFVILLLAQMLFAFVGNSNVYPMLALIGMLAVAGYSFCNLGYDPAASDVYRIDDDMQPAVVQAIGNKVVASDDEIKTIFAENEEKEKAKAIANEDVSATADVHEKTDISFAKAEIDNSKAIETVSEEKSINEDTLKDTEDFVSLERNTADFGVNNEDVQINSESRYSEPEERKTTDFGMRDADFASLFDGSAIPPKFARGDMYSDWNLEEESEVLEESAEDIEDEEVKEEVVSVAQSDENETKTEEQDDTKDKKAYVDTFFSYLYDESVFEQPIEPIEEKEETSEVYVSNASKFADLELDLGTDAFDYVPAENETLSVENEMLSVENEMLSVENETLSVENEILSAENELLSAENEISSIENEALSAEYEAVSVEDEITSVENEIEDTNDSIEEDSSPIEEQKNLNFFAEDSFYSTSDKTNKEEYAFGDNNETVIKENEDINIEEEFDFDEVIPRRNNEDYSSTTWDNISSSTLEKSLDEYSQNVEAEVYKALAEFDSVKEEEDISVEEAIERKIREEDDFSYEEAIAKRLEEEALQKEIGFSLEEALEKKLDVEDSIKEAEMKMAFSYEETLANKIALEESLESVGSDSDLSAEDVISKKFEIEDALNNSMTETEFSIQEAIEQKIDVERAIDNAINKPILDVLDEFDNVDRVLSEDENALLIEGENILNPSVIEKESSYEPEQETVTEEFSFEPVEENVTEELNFGPVAEEVTEEFSFEPVEEKVTEEFSFEPVAEEVTEEFSFEPVAEEVTEEFSFEPIAEKVTEEFSFEPMAEKVTEEFSFEPTAEKVTEEFSFEPVAEKVTEEFSFEPMTEEVTEEFSFEPVTEAVTEEVINSYDAPEDDFEGDSSLDSSVFSESEPVTETPKVIDYIENPLPLPKKHVHRELDYGRSIPGNWMHYDVEINSKNNFYDI